MKVDWGSALGWTIQGLRFLPQETPLELPGRGWPDNPSVGATALMASSAIHHLLFLSFLPFLPVFSASNITLGLSISAIGDNSSWISPSEEFAFGFRQLDNTNIFLIAIWYTKIPNKTIIWHANTTSLVQTESKVELTTSGLTLNSPNGQAIWKAPLPLDTTISYATMLDTSNFVLSSSTNNSVYAWQSFSYPTDTILPTQVLSQGGMLYSRLTETNYSNGRFELHFMNGALELKVVTWPSRLVVIPLFRSSSRANPQADHCRFEMNEWTKGRFEMNEWAKGRFDVNEWTKGRFDVNEWTKGRFEMNEWTKGRFDVNEWTKGRFDVNEWTKGRPDINEWTKGRFDTCEWTEGRFDMNE
ncbi:hypothetical protein HYC85_012028 [Camellia sinensis]|uniref:Bulb-type lectin domain-containing protein n=1 Tax=Camellia sinensis TaxID=4442 RepID=A0A7J7HBN6_CAMSI|nr:hypothetical protein HYC85_012028 [Camellia sinensis]